MLRSIYTVLSVTEHTVTLQGCDQGKSVTNDAENVVKELLGKYGPKRFVYYDTMGNRDELCHDSKCFTHFAPAREHEGQTF